MKNVENKKQTEVCMDMYKGKNKVIISYPNMKHYTILMNKQLKNSRKLSAKHM